MELSHKSLKPALIYLFFVAWAINIALHVPSFSRTKFRGDENVYLALSQSMGWDLSNYSTASNPVVSTWPNTTYQNPLFHHGPLLPYVMKIGAVFGSRTTAALLFENLAMAMLFAHLWLFYRRLSIPPEWQMLGFFAAAFAPLLLFSTTRMHLDAASGIFVTCAVVAFIEALEKRSAIWSGWSGLLLATALNLRFSAIAGLVLIVLLQMFYGYSVKSNSAGIGSGRRILTPMRSIFERWKAFGIVSLIVAVFGLQHFYRLFAAYGSIIPADFMQPTLTDPWYQFLLTRTRGKSLVNLILLVPLFSVFFVPQTWRAVREGLARKDWGAVCTVFTLYLLLVLFAFSHEEMRFFALATPMFYCSLPWIIAHGKASLLPFYACLIAISLFLMITAGYREALVRPNEVYQIVPVVYELIPPLRKYW